jgi:hypothetical protein
MCGMSSNKPPEGYYFQKPKTKSEIKNSMAIDDNPIGNFMT